MSITTIGIVGAGQMGGGIAQVAAQSGYDVILMDLNKDQIDKTMLLMSSLTSSKKC
jgi:3-hydroxybutyryl-CoA dehydrogenase